MVVCLAGLWTFAAWAFSAIASWTATNVGALTKAGVTAEALQLPTWLAPWVTPKVIAAGLATMKAFQGSFDAVLGVAPALGSGLATAVWVIWGVGIALLLAFGAVVSIIIAVARRRSAQRHS